MRVIPTDTRLKGKVLIAGFHGIGATGYWTVRFLIKELKAERLCYIDYEHSPAVSSLFSGRISTPYEIYRAGDISLFKSEILPLREKENEFYRSFAEWVIGSSVDEVALVGGLDESLRVDETKYRVALTSKMIEKGDMKEEPFLEDDRMIVGPVATLLNYFEINNFPAFALLAYSSTERVDPRAAANAAEFLSKRYGFSVDISPLIKGAEELESEIKELEQREKRPSSPVYS
jgi:predicted ATP-grasp superfamily ATP-dependent carboligase